MLRYGILAAMAMLVATPAMAQAPACTPASPPNRASPAHLTASPPLRCCVLAQIRVADDAAEWTVSRRYRNFESLHRQLRGSPAYRLKLPPKRIFIHSHQ